MGRIDKALRRASAQAEPSAAADVAQVAPPDPPRNASDVPPADVFSAPWTFDGTEVNLSRAGAAPPAVPPLPGSAAIFQGFDPATRDRLVVPGGNGHHAVMAVATEQYRRLAAALHHAQMERRLKVIMVTSALAGEGKTLTCTNLGLTFSESYRRQVLLVDADLRRPGLHQMFQVPNVSGLGDGLKDDAEHKLSLLQITPQLTLLPAGRPDPDPMGPLTSPRMRRILEEAAARFDWVIVDTPPVGLLTDANLLARMVDATVLVVEAGTTPYPVVNRAVQAIGRDRIVGVVLNRTDLPAGTYGYRYDRYYAGYRPGKAPSSP